MEKTKNAKLPEPVFNNEREDFVVTFYNGEYPELYPKELMKYQEAQVNAQVNAQDKQKNAQVKQGKINEKSILDFCTEEKTLRQIVEHFGYKSVRGFREKYINVLIKQGKLRQTIPDKPTSRNQKYISVK